MRISLSAPPAALASTRAGWIVSALPALVMLADGVTKAIAVEAVVDAMDELGYSEAQTIGIGLLALACTIVYLIPRTAVIGAVLLTGYLGGAVAASLRAGEGIFPIVFPVLIGALFWLGLYLRDERIRVALATGH